MFKIGDILCLVGVLLFGCFIALAAPAVFYTLPAIVLLGGGVVQTIEGQAARTKIKTHSH